MRTLRVLLVGLVAATLAPRAGAAQKTNGFEDSWFWGVKGGTMMFTADEYTVAPSVGAEWLITRSRAALSLSVEQAFFETRTTVYDPTVTAAARSVDIKNLQRFHFGVFVFPFELTVIRPYAGLGLALNNISTATPIGTYANQAAQDTVMARVDRHSSRPSAVLTAGAQAQVWKVALFGQVSTMPTRSGFLINGAPNTMVAEVGMRIRVADAIEKMK